MVDSMRKGGQRESGFDEGMMSGESARDEASVNQEGDLVETVTGEFEGMVQDAHAVLDRFVEKVPGRTYEQAFARLEEMTQQVGQLAKMLEVSARRFNRGDEVSEEIVARWDAMRSSLQQAHDQIVEWEGALREEQNAKEALASIQDELFELYTIVDDIQKGKLRLDRPADFAEYAPKIQQRLQGLRDQFKPLRDRLGNNDVFRENVATLERRFHVVRDNFRELRDTLADRAAAPAAPLPPGRP